MKHSIEEQTLALAGVLQAAYLANQIATQGMCDADSLETSLQSIIITNPQNTQEIYGGITNMKKALKILKEQLGTEQPQKNMITLRYMINLFVLAHKFRHQPKLLDIMATEIEKVKSQTEHFAINHTNIVSHLADIYQNTISKLMPKIMVQGNQMHLHNESNAAKIRATLLAGIRSAVLWQQLGGNRFQLLLNRKQYLAAVDNLLNQEIVI